MRKEYDRSTGKRGAVIPSTGMTRITIMLNDDVIEHFRAKAEAKGTGYQTMPAVETSLAARFLDAKLGSVGLEWRRLSTFRRIGAVFPTPAR